MDDDAVRAMLLSVDRRLLESYRLNVEARETLEITHQSIRQTQDLIDRTDLLIACLSKALPGFADV